jgi:uncharacterized protein with HXXEE motif
MDMAPPLGPRTQATIAVALLVHNAEEGLTIGAAWPRLKAAADHLLGQPARLPTPSQYQVALAALTLLGFALLIAARRWPSARYTLVVLQATMALNVVVHVGAAIALAGYAPGLVTALTVQAPVSAFVFKRLRESGWLSASRSWTLFIAAALLVGPGLWLLLAWARTT